MSTKIAKAAIPAAESFGQRQPKDKAVRGGLRELYPDAPGWLDALELWPAYVRRIHMGRFLAHYELFRQIVDLPGSIVEIGVYRGPSLLTWGKLMEMFCPGDRSRRVYGFDSFEGLGELSAADGKADPSVGKMTGGWSAASVRAEVEELVRIANLDNMVSRHERTKLVIGDVKYTLPKFLEDHPGLRISLLHIDCDLYDPTWHALVQLYPLVVKGGVVVFDEYGLEPWQGETNAADSYFNSLGTQPPTFRKFPWTHNPHGYFVK